MFAVIVSNSTPLFSSFFILATIAIMSTHVLLFALSKFTPLAATLLKKVQDIVDSQIPFLEVAISFGLIADLFTPYRSLLATVMYFWVFMRQRLGPIPMHVFQPAIYRQPHFAPSATRNVWSKVDQIVAPFFNNIPVFNHTCFSTASFGSFPYVFTEFGMAIHRFQSGSDLVLELEDVCIKVIFH